VDQGNRKHNADAVGNQYPAVGKIKMGSAETLAVLAAIGPLTAKNDSTKPLRKEQWLPNALVAMDAETGRLLWRYEEPRWNHLVAAGDEWMSERLQISKTNPKTDVLCLPDPQGIPLISGDGTVYMSSSHSGELTAIKDKDGNGIIDAVDISIFSTHTCFLNSPSIAEGMLVAAPCWGPMYVFKGNALATGSENPNIAGFEYIQRQGPPRLAGVGEVAVSVSVSVSMQVRSEGDAHGR